MAFAVVAWFHAKRITTGASIEEPHLSPSRPSSESVTESTHRAKPDCPEPSRSLESRVIRFRPPHPRGGDDQMTWEAPTIVEIKMDAEINSYQEDRPEDL
jgi:hypothetical protein